jgi:hypothetical protein
MLLIPAALYIAIAVACTIFIFPQSLNHIVITDLIKTNLRPIQSILSLQDEVVETKTADEEKISELAGKAKGLRLKHVQGVNAVEGQMGLLQLEVTRGQIGAADLNKIFEKAKELGSRSYGLASFVVRCHEVQRPGGCVKLTCQMLTDESHKSLFKVSREDESHTNHRIKHAVNHMEKHRHAGTKIDDLLPIIASSTSDLRSAAKTGLDDAIKWLDVANHSRWTRPPKGATEISFREANLARLKETLAEFRATKHFELLKPYRELFDERGNVRPEAATAMRASTPTVFRCNVFTSSLISFSIVLVGFLELLLEVERANPKARIQLPAAFAKMLVKSVNDKSGGGNPLDLGTGNSEDDSSDGASSTTTLVENKKEKVKKATRAKAKTYGMASRPRGRQRQLIIRKRSRCGRSLEWTAEVWERSSSAVEGSFQSSRSFCIQVRSSQCSIVVAAGHSVLGVLYVSVARSPEETKPDQQL